MALGWMLSILQRGRAAMQRLSEIFAVEPAIDEPPRRAASAPRPCAARSPSQRVELRLSRRRERPPRARRRDLHCPGRAHGGRSSGAPAPARRRSSQLLPRLFDVSAGRGARSTGATCARCRSRCCAARSASCRRTRSSSRARSATTSRFARPTATTDDERVAWAAEIGRRSTRDVAEMPRGFETIVGERGITLSGGQKQRVTLARALLADRDRSSSSTTRSRASTRDTEERILERLRGFLRERTTILVAHRISTVKDADLIVVLDEGRIVELGDHASAARARRPLRRALPRQRLDRGAGGDLSAAPGVQPPGRPRPQARDPHRGGARQAPTTRARAPAVDLHPAVRATSSGSRCACLPVSSALHAGAAVPPEDRASTATSRVGDAARPRRARRSSSSAPIVGEFALALRPVLPDHDGRAAEPRRPARRALRAPRSACR